MSDQPERPRGSGRHRGDPERSLISAVRCALLPAICMPAALASLCAGVGGGGLPLALAGPLAALALIVNVACWRRVIMRWRALPRPEDDDDGWRRWSLDGDPPLEPSGGPGGIRFDWAVFERDFWAHVTQQERLRERERELIRALGAAARRPVSELVDAIARVRPGASAIA
jgi:hypothetical protein